MTAAQSLAKIRAECLALPGTVEKSSWGHPNFAAGRIYASLDEYDGRPSVCVLSTKPEQSRLLHDERQGGPLFVPPYVGGKGWIGVWLDRGPRWPLVQSLLRAAHALATSPPKRAAVRTRPRKP